MRTFAAGRPSWLLTAAEGYVGDDVNERTAIGLTRTRLTIKATFFPNSPPQPSNLCVRCPDAKDIMNPCVLCMAGDFILFRVNIVTGSLRIPRDSYPWREYFVYRAEPNRATLELLPDQPTFFDDCEVGILPRGNGDFTIAALAPCPPCLEKFKLLLFHSKASSWTSMKLSHVGPPKEIPMIVQDRYADLSRHMTTNVIIIGGEYGTMGWVDLWRGILLCDVLSEKPNLRSIPVPLPMRHLLGNNGLGIDFGRGVDSRGIAFVNGCLKFVELELSVTELMHIMDEETGFPTMMVHGWNITTYSNSKMSSSYNDWHKDGMVLSSEVTINNPMVSHSGGLLLLPSQEHCEMATTRKALDKLVVSDPSPSLSDNGVVYLVARVKLWHPMSWLIALDMSNKTLQSVVPFVSPEDPDAAVKYCTSRQ
uniref:Uncharacterized protein n=1 Tax=Avena sativa TaxID=4498 RepID=A0ACD5U9N0_AVESA